jgi:hypothetical protein
MSLSQEKHGGTSAGRADWVRFDRYEIAGGWIRPAKKAAFNLYRPAEDHFGKRCTSERPALDWLVDLGAAVNPSHAEILHWCDTFGALGLLHQTCISIDTPAWEWTDSAGRSFVQDRFMACGPGWLCSHLEAAEHPRACAMMLAAVGAFDGQGREATSVSLEGWDGFCTMFFPAVHPQDRYAHNFGLKALLGLEATGLGAAWSDYYEPVELWLKSARKISNAVRAQDAEALSSLATRSGIRVERDGSKLKQAIASASLLGMLAVIAVQELTGGARPVQCAARGCGRIFLTYAYQAEYCSGPCQWRERKARQRALKAALAMPNYMPVTHIDGHIHGPINNKVRR